MPHPSERRLAVLVSGNGTNLQALIDAVSDQRLKQAAVQIVISDNPDAYALERAKKSRIKTVTVDRKRFSSRADFDAALLITVRESKPDVIVLAGFMRVLSANFVRAFPHKIINIHPALLPSFKGLDAIDQALEYGVRVMGCTVHFVDEDVDHGPIILQEAISLTGTESKDEITERIHKLEHRCLVDAVDLVLNRKLKIDGRRVTFEL